MRGCEACKFGKFGPEGAGCNKKIRGGSYVKIGGKTFHKECKGLAKSLAPAAAPAAAGTKSAAGGKAGVKAGAAPAL